MIYLYVYRYKHYIYIHLWHSVTVNVWDIWYHNNDYDTIVSGNICTFHGWNRSWRQQSLDDDILNVIFMYMYVQYNFNVQIRIRYQVSTSTLIARWMPLWPVCWEIGLALPEKTTVLMEHGTLKITYLQKSLIFRTLIFDINLSSWAEQNQSPTTRNFQVRRLEVYDFIVRLRWGPVAWRPKRHWCSAIGPLAPVIPLIIFVRHSTWNQEH